MPAHDGAKGVEGPADLVIAAIRLSIRGALTVGAESFTPASTYTTVRIPAVACRNPLLRWGFQ